MALNMSVYAYLTKLIEMRYKIALWNSLFSLLHSLSLSLSLSLHISVSFSLRSAVWRSTSQEVSLFREARESFLLSVLLLIIGSDFPSQRTVPISSLPACALWGSFYTTSCLSSYSLDRDRASPA